MTAIANRVQATLLNLTSKDSKQLVESLCNLSDLIENKSDPDQNELYILENIYKAKESLNLLTNNLKKHNRGIDIHTNPGSKLSDLFSRNGIFD